MIMIIIHKIFCWNAWFKNFKFIIFFVIFDLVLNTFSLTDIGQSITDEHRESSSIKIFLLNSEMLLKRNPDWIFFGVEALVRAVFIIPGIGKIDKVFPGYNFNLHKQPNCKIFWTVQILTHQGAVISDSCEGGGDR